MDCSMPGFPVHNQLLELAQTHVHWVGDAIQPFHPVLPFSSYLQSFSASGSFPMSQFFASDDQSIGVSPSSSVLPMNIQYWFPLGLTGLILQSKGLTRVFSNTTVQKHQLVTIQLCLWSNSHIHTWLLKKPQLWLTDLYCKNNVSAFNILSRLFIALLPRSKHLLISWLQSPSAVILEPKKIKSVTVSIVFPSICHEVIGLDVMILIFWMLSFKAAFSLFFFTFIKRLFSSSSLSAIRVVSSAYLKLLLFLLAILIPAFALSSPDSTGCTLHRS